MNRGPVDRLLRIGERYARAREMEARAYLRRVTADTSDSPVNAVGFHHHDEPDVRVAGPIRGRKASGSNT